MTIIEIFLIAVGLAMDAFAVSICKGIKMRPFNYKRATLIAVTFGLAQALMPLIGWFLGKQFESYIVAIDHWIAFILLAFIGGKMAIESFKKDENECESCDNFAIGELLLMAVATSIDALAVGITFAFLQVDLISSVSIIGITTLVLCFAGAGIGSKFGSALKSKAEFVGGLILVLMGLKILLEHLGFISF